MLACHQLKMVPLVDDHSIMYENHSAPMLPIRRFLQRVTSHTLMAFGVILVALAIGVFGYHLVEGLDWIDALLNASMLLGGMGPVNALQTTGGKLFASFYALFAGLVIVGVSGLLLAPFFPRVLHRVQLERDPDQSA